MLSLLQPLIDCVLCFVDNTRAIAFDPLLERGEFVYPCVDTAKRPTKAADRLSCGYNRVAIGSASGTHLFIPAYRLHAVASTRPRACFALY